MTWLLDPLVAVLGHISQFGTPPCRVGQVGEGVSPTLDALRHYTTNSEMLEARLGVGQSYLCWLGITPLTPPVGSSTSPSRRGIK
jgi:hypothetical protein